jgi:hypothetical protein
MSKRQSFGDLKHYSSAWGKNYVWGLYFLTLWEKIRFASLDWKSQL